MLEKTKRPAITHSKRLKAINRFVYFFVSCLSVGKEKTLLALLKNSLGLDQLLTFKSLILTWIDANPDKGFSNLLKRNERKECLLEGYYFWIGV